MEILTFLSEYIAPALISSGIVLGVLKFLGSSLVNQLFQKELEKYKSQLQEKATYLKTSLSIYSEEQNIANQRIDNQRAEAIHKIYSSMCDISYPLSRIIAGSPYVTEDNNIHINFYREHAEKGQAACSALSAVLINHAIYFDETTYKQISDYSTEVANVMANFLKMLRQNEAEALASSEELLSILEEKRIEIGKAFNASLRELKYQLIKKFRKQLGIEK